MTTCHKMIIYWNLTWSSMQRIHQVCLWVWNHGNQQPGQMFYGLKRDTRRCWDDLRTPTLPRCNGECGCFRCMLLRLAPKKKKILLKSFIHNTAQRNNFRLNSGCSVEKDRYAVALTQMNGSLSRAEQHKGRNICIFKLPICATYLHMRHFSMLITQEHFNEVLALRTWANLRLPKDYFVYDSKRKIREGWIFHRYISGEKPPLHEPSPWV